MAENHWETAVMFFDLKHFTGNITSSDVTPF